MQPNNWLVKQRASLHFGDRLADAVAKEMGSWRFIIFQSIFVVGWMVVNVIGYFRHWDVYPFILLNLIFSTQAAYAAPIIMMSQNRQSQMDRLKAENDYQVNMEAKKEIEALQIQLSKLESEKLDKIIQMLEKLQNS